MAAKKKVSKKKAPEKRQRRSSAGAPDVSSIRGDVIATPPREKVEREIDQMIAAGANIRDARLARIEKKQKYAFDEFGYYRKTSKKPCQWMGTKPMHKGRVELDVISERDAEKLGVPAGPAIRLCIKPNEAAPFISVKDPEEALRIATAFRDCAVAGGDVRKCGIDTVSRMRGVRAEDVRFAGNKKRTRR